MGVDVNKYLEAADEAEKRRPRGARDWWTAKEGRNQIRIASDPASQEVGFRDAGVHFIDKRPYFCPNITLGEQCPVCEYVDQLYKAGSEEDVTLAKSLKAQSRYYYNVIDRDDLTKGVQVFGAPPTVQDQIRDCFREYGDITDPKEGNDLVITKDSKKAPALMYRVQVDPRGASRVGLSGWEEQLFDLEDYVSPMEYDDLAKVLRGEAEAPEPEPERRGPPPSSPAGRRRTAEPRGEEEEQEPADDPVGKHFKEPEDKPAPRRKPAPAPAKRRGSPPPRRRGR